MNGKVYKFIEVDESVLKVKDGIVYVCDSEKVAQLFCPCGCLDIIYLPMIEGEKPCWKIVGNTITPSVQRKVGCLSHFTITNGIVKKHK